MYIVFSIHKWSIKCHIQDSSHAGLRSRSLRGFWNREGRAGVELPSPVLVLGLLCLLGTEGVGRAVPGVRMSRAGGRGRTRVGVLVAGCGGPAPQAEPGSCAGSASACSLVSQRVALAPSLPPPAELQWGKRGLGAATATHSTLEPILVAPRDRQHLLVGCAGAWALPAQQHLLPEVLSRQEGQVGTVEFLGPTLIPQERAWHPLVTPSHSGRWPRAELGERWAQSPHPPFNGQEP